MVGNVENRNVQRVAHRFQLVLGSRPPDSVPTNQHRSLGLLEQSHNPVEVVRTRPRPRRNLGTAHKRPLVLSGGFLKGTEHDVHRNTQMHRAGITTEGDFVGAVHEFWDALAVGDRGTVLGQRFSNADIINLLKTAAALTLEGAGARNEDHRGAFAPCLHHRRNRVGKAFRADEANRGCAADPCETIGQMSSHLLMRRVDHRHPALGHTLQGRIAKPSAQREHLGNTFFVQGSREQHASAYFHVKYPNFGSIVRLGNCSW